MDHSERNQGGGGDSYGFRKRFYFAPKPSLMPIMSPFMARRGRERLANSASKARTISWRMATCCISGSRPDMLARFHDIPCGPAEAAVRRGEQQGDPPIFDSAFRDRLTKLFAWRRDVRRFKPDPVPSPLIEELLGLAALAPSVGNSQPWRFVSVETLSAREAVIANFNACNATALASYEGERAALYASLKLSGLREAPVHLAVFCDHATEAGSGLEGPGFEPRLTESESLNPWSP